MEDMEILTERWELARGRIEEICEELKNERVDLDKFSAYFLMEAEWFAHLFKTADRVNGEAFEKLDEADLTALMRSITVNCWEKDTTQAMQIPLSQWNVWEKNTADFFLPCMYITGEVSVLYMMKRKNYFWLLPNFS